MSGQFRTLAMFFFFSIATNLDLYLLFILNIGRASPISAFFCPVALHLPRMKPFGTKGQKLNIFDCEKNSRQEINVTWHEFKDKYHYTRSIGTSYRHSQPEYLTPDTLSLRYQEVQSLCCHGRHVSISWSP